MRIEVTIAAVLLMTALKKIATVPAPAGDGNEANGAQADPFLQSQQRAGDGFHDPDALDLR